MLILLDSLLKDYLDFWNNGGDFSTPFGKFDMSMFNNASNFIPTNNGYELTMDVDFDTTENDIEINLEKDGLVEIKYHKKNECSEHIIKVTEYLPKDADPDTLDAVVKNGELIVTVSKK
jgi:HSP20 family molecular chaperone IbpA